MSNTERNNKGQFVKGYGFWLGKKRPELKTKTQFNKGNIPWNKSDLTKQCLNCERHFRIKPSLMRMKYCSHKCQFEFRHKLAISISDRDKNCTNCGRFIMRKSNLCKSCANLGSLSPGYKHGNWRKNASERKFLMHSAPYTRWRKMVFERDNFTCRMCGTVGGKLQADHIKTFMEYPELRFSLDNGRTLCVSCHLKTPTYGGRAKKIGGGVHEFQSCR